MKMKATAKQLTNARRKEKNRSAYKQPELEAQIVKKIEQYASEQPYLVESHFTKNELEVFLEAKEVIKSGTKKELAGRIITYVTEGADKVKKGRKRKRGEQEKTQAKPRVRAMIAPKRRRVSKAMETGQEEKENGKGKEKEDSTGKEKEDGKGKEKEGGKGKEKDREKGSPLTGAATTPKRRGRPRKKDSGPSLSESSRIELVIAATEGLTPEDLMEATQLMLQKIRFHLTVPPGDPLLNQPALDSSIAPSGTSLSIISPLPTLFPLSDGVTAGTA